MSWKASFKVEHSASCEIFGQHLYSSETQAVVAVTPNLETAAMDSGVPIGKITAAAIDFAIDLVSEKTGVDKNHLYVEKVDGNRVFVLSKCGSTFKKPVTK